MRRMTSVMLVALLASAQANANFFNGTHLNEWIQDMEKPDGGRFNAGLLSGYVAGIVDLGEGALFCLPPGATSGQYRAVVVKYVKNNPEQWDRPASALVVEALQKACPCPQKRK